MQSRNWLSTRKTFDAKAQIPYVRIPYVLGTSEYPFSTSEYSFRRKVIQINSKIEDDARMGSMNGV